MKIRNVTVTIGHVYLVLFVLSLTVVSSVSLFIPEFSGVANTWSIVIILTLIPYLVYRAYMIAREQKSQEVVKHDSV